MGLTNLELNRALLNAQDRIDRLEAQLAEAIEDRANAVEVAHTEQGNVIRLEREIAEARATMTPSACNQCSANYLAAQTAEERVGMARAAALEEAAKMLEGGRFLHDEAPTARLAREAAAAIRALAGQPAPRLFTLEQVERAAQQAHDDSDLDQWQGDWAACFRAALTEGK